MRHHQRRRTDADTCDPTDPYTGNSLGHEQLLEALVTGLLGGDTLEHLCTDADLPVLVDDTGEPVTVTARTYPDASVLTLDHGIWLELSDGSVFGLTVTVSRRPTVEVQLRG
ncbi:hypothetical protein [Virgisporangium aurantiacum]|uniref:Halobacterial output domain-containing protein n=1 Tax=Virgisporangium aurantiacum TaxID=175570 RepID=A0A8J4E779_9ACTN|nr:hypothetical protein [Virgisporangium aurantiacum]GIJ64840.1 hypothetical protein Vau01_123560 [Virgisporangium aurantiacum]